MQLYKKIYMNEVEAWNIYLKKYMLELQIRYNQLCPSM